MPDAERKSLEEFILETIKNGGSVKDLAPIINLLPEEKKNHYREVWKQAMEERKQKHGIHS